MQRNIFRGFCKKNNKKQKNNSSQGQKIWSRILALLLTYVILDKSFALYMN